MSKIDQEPEKQLVVSRMRTPDGTLLVSLYNHHFVSHTDANGDEYFLDGGSVYQRHSINKAPLVDESIYVGDDHSQLREYFSWGTRGKDGKSPLEFKALKDLTTDHIVAILETQKQLPEWRRDIFKAELSFRALIGQKFT